MQNLQALEEALNLEAFLHLNRPADRINPEAFPTLKNQRWIQTQIPAQIPALKIQIPIVALKDPFYQFHFLYLGVIVATDTGHL